MKRNRVLILLVCLGGFAVIAWQISVKDVLIFDTVIRQWFYSIRSDGLTAVLKAVSYTHLDVYKRQVSGYGK